MNFREAVQARALPPSTFSALIRDLAMDLEDLQPALIDLGSRRTFQQLPLQSSPAEQLLARDALMSQLSVL